jgi:multidrug efflux system membrane fusion protein
VPQDRIPQLQARIATGDRLVVTAYDRTRTAPLDTGEFLSLNNQSDVQTGTVRAKARFANARGTLFPSQFVNVRILLDTVRNAVVVPVTALRHGPTGDFVYVLDGDRTVSLRTVTTGQASADSVAIATGLEAGERVITEGGDRLKDGARVTLPGDVASGPRRGASGAGFGASGASGARGQYGHRRDGAASGAAWGGPWGAGSGAAPGAGGGSWPRGRRASEAAS